MSLTNRVWACGIRSRASRVPLWPYVPGSLAQRLLNATIDVQEHRVAGYSANRIQYVYPDCVFWMLPRYAVDAKMRPLVAGRNLYMAK